MANLITIDSLTVGEIGERNVEIRDSVTNLNYEVSASLVSEITFVVHDPEFRMNNNNYFMIGRRVVFNGIEFEIAAVKLNHGSTDRTDVTARSRPMQRMRREKGSANFGAISPTAFASTTAERFGMNFFGQQSPIDGNIQRVQDENNDESTFDVLSRLASDLKFRFFEARNTLFFATEEFIVNSQPALEVNVPSETTDTLYASDLKLRKSVDADTAATFQASFLKTDTTTQLFPGMSVRFNNVNGFDGVFMIDRVGFDLFPNTFVSVAGTDVVDQEEIACSRNTFAIGSSGECVKRIQMAVGAKVDGIFGRRTEAAVRDLQLQYALPATGVVDAATWERIIGL